MLKHVKPRDILEVFLFLVAFTGIFAFAGYLDAKPLGLTMWMAGGVAIILWVVYIIVVAHQRNQEAKNTQLYIKTPNGWEVVSDKNVHHLAASYGKNDLTKE